MSARLELPFHAKYLLIASYLASHNPARTDASYFAKVCWLGWGAQVPCFCVSLSFFSVLTTVVVPHLQILCICLFISGSGITAAASEVLVRAQPRQQLPKPLLLEVQQPFL